MKHFARAFQNLAPSSNIRLKILIPFASRKRRIFRENRADAGRRACGRIITGFFVAQDKGLENILKILGKTTFRGVKVVVLLTSLLAFFAEFPLFYFPLLPRPDISYLLRMPWPPRPEIFLFGRGRSVYVPMCVLYAYGSKNIPKKP